jgi:hypothetical protein
VRMEPNFPGLALDWREWVRNVEGTQACSLKHCLSWVETGT